MPEMIPDYVSKLNALSESPVDQGTYDKAIVALINQLGKSEPASIGISPVSGALANAGGPVLGLTPEQVIGGYNTAISSALADTKAGELDIARQMMPAERMYKTGQGVKALRETAAKERKIQLEAITSNLDYIEEKARREAKSKGLAENEVETEAAKAIDEYAIKKGIGPIVIPGMQPMTLGQMRLSAKIPALQAAIAAHSKVIGDQLLAGSRVKAAEIGAGAITNPAKLENQLLRDLISALSVERAAEAGDITRIGKPSETGKAAQAIREYIAGKAGISSRGAPSSQSKIPEDATNVTKGTYQGKVGTFYKVGSKAYFLPD